jgi:hypothetical protein
MELCEMYSEFWSENLKVRENLKDLREDESMIFKWIGEMSCVVVD